MNCWSTPSSTFMGRRGSEQSCGVRVDGVAGGLSQLRRTTEVILQQTDHAIVQHVGYRQMLILPLGQIDCIALLVGIHDVLVVLQASQIAFGVVERQVHVVGEVGEDILQMCRQGIGHAEFGHRGQLCFQLGGHIRH